MKIVFSLKYDDVLTSLLERMNRRWRNQKQIIKFKIDTLNNIVFNSTEDATILFPSRHCLDIIQQRIPWSVKHGMWHENDRKMYGLWSLCDLNSNIRKKIFIKQKNESYHIRLPSEHQNWVACVLEKVLCENVNCFTCFVSTE